MPFWACLLQHVHFNSLSIENLLRLGRTTLSGPSGDDLHREVERRFDLPKENPKSRYLSVQEALSPALVTIFRCQLQPALKLQGERYCPCYVTLCAGTKVNCLLRTVGGRRIISWKPGDPSSCVRPVAGEGAAVTGINDLGTWRTWPSRPAGDVFVADWQNRRILRFSKRFWRLSCWQH